MSDFLSLIWATFRDPRGGLRFVLNLGLTMRDRWMVFALSVILPTILIALVLMAVPMPEGGVILLSPLPLALSQGFGMGLMVFLAHWVGRMRGGRGSFADSLLTVAWLQIVIVLILMAVMVIELALPMVAAVFVIVATFLIFWILTNFVAELHGFTSLPLTFVGIVLTVVAANFVVALLVAPFMGAPNV